MKITQSQPVPTGERVTASSRYEALVQNREPYLRRARTCALYTIPGLMPPQGHNGSQDLYQPFQSVGADGVNNLASKIALVLFPPGSPFFKLELDDFTVEKLAQAAQQEFEDARAEFDEALSKMERSVVSKMEENGTRAVLFEVFKHLIVTGNILVHVMEDGRPKAIPLDRFVVKRDGSGQVVDIVVKESMSPKALPPAARAIYLAHNKTGEASGSNPTEDKNVDIFTWIVRDTGDEGFKYHQEVCGEIIPQTIGSTPKGKESWLPLRWSHVAGEDYGRSRCDEYIGDLRTLESIEKSIILFTAVASKVLCLVNESGTTRKQDVEEAKSGDIIDGDPEDVGFVMLEKDRDFTVVASQRGEKQSRLERAFLLATSVQRDAERVTAEEIRAMVGELEQSLGGVYSVLSEELQRPLVIRIMFQMEKKGDLPKLPKDTVRPKIVTGIEGLGRASDLQKLLTFLATIAEHLGPEAVRQFLNIPALMKRFAAALGVDITGLVKSQEQIAQEQQQATMAQMTEKLGPSVINGISKQAQAAQPPGTESPA